jgi:hypothetical protein
MICEICWANAYTRSYGTGKSQYECYLELLEERKDNPCQPEAQAGFWLCPNCHITNAGFRSVCSECETERNK